MQIKVSDSLRPKVKHPVINAGRLPYSYSNSQFASLRLSCLVWDLRILSASTTTSLLNLFLVFCVAILCLVFSGCDEETIVAGTSSPSAPVSLSAVSGGSQVTLSWTAPATDGGSAVVDYKIYRKCEGGCSNYFTNVGSDATTFGDIAVTSGTSYTYTVAAVNAAGEGNCSEEETAIFVAATGIPSVPQNLIARGSDEKIILTWTTPLSDGDTAITHYNVSRGTNPGALVKVATVGPSADPAYEDSPLTNGATYFYVVTAVNDVGNSPESTEAFVVLVNAPSAPQNFSGVSALDQYIELEWEAPLSDGGASVIAYKIYRTLEVVGTTYLATVGSDVTTFADESVISGTSYTYTVVAMNAAGEGEPSGEVTASFTKAPVAPAAPSGLSAAGYENYASEGQPAGNGKINLTWTIPSDGGSDITHYNVYRGTNPGALTKVISVNPIVQRSYEDTLLTLGGTYFYAVTAVNDVGESLESNEVYVVLQFAPSAPQSLEGALHGVAVHLNWQLPLSDGGNAIIAYRIKCYEPYGGDTTFYWGHSYAPHFYSVQR